jgi:acyl transferase domain-containing protein/NADPH:quinone reductase-like Zn-dependent oxidoreductase/alpha-beta hydrolase superfamily lysophospholipase
LATRPSIPSADGAAEASVAETQPVAIIGIGCRYPGGIEDPHGFWDLLLAGIDAICDIPADRWDADAYYDAVSTTPGRMIMRQGGFLRSAIDRFDASFFGMTPREAASLDPQQRLLLEVTWESFEDAGLPPSSTAGGAVGCFIGGFTSDAMTNLLTSANRRLLDSTSPQGVAMTMLAARLSYTFDWHGPCFTLDSACSSSLVALHQACCALGRGECEIAIAGGVNVMFNPATTMLMSKGQFLSPDARCKSFDSRANGYARAEGAGVLLLKPLESAVRDGDRIRAVIRGTAVNQDGRTIGITVPSREAQLDAIRKACRAGDTEPRSIGYFEAHGTGTAVGDPIEIAAIADALGDSRRTHWVGSVKSNIGHCEAAAGVAGVIKASLCLEHQTIPPNLHFESPNPRIPFHAIPLSVPVAAVAFPEYDTPRRAGINSFGFGGTNAHAILEQAPGTAIASHNEDDAHGPHLLALSARSPEALHSLVTAYADLVAGSRAPALGQLGRALARQRDHHSVRTYVVAEDRVQASELLRNAGPASQPAAGSGVAFVYSGMGPQWWGMGRELLSLEPRFAAAVDACDEVLESFGVCISEELLREESESRLTSTKYAQIASFVVQAGLTALWREWGVEPTAIVGHSVGEVAAAYAAGVYSLHDALTISFHRANLQGNLARHGLMAAIGRSAEDIRPFLSAGVEIAAYNSPTTATISGDPDDVERVSQVLRNEGIPVKALRVERAFHSRHMEEICEPLVHALSAIRPRAADIPLYSTVTGGRIRGAEMDAEYWWRNVREPVLFGAAFDELASSSPRVVLEVGPHPVLAASIDEIAERHGRQLLCVASLRRDRGQRQQMLESLGTIYAAGINPDWCGVYPGPRGHLDLPRYPWQRERHWAEAPASRMARQGTGAPRLAGRPIEGSEPVREVELSAAEFPYLADHRVGDTVVFPGSGYLEAALAFFPEDEPCFLEDVVFHRPLALRPASITTLRIAYEPRQRILTMHSREQDDSWTLHTELRRAEPVRPPHPVALDSAPPDLTRSLPEYGHDDVYAHLGRSALNYGAAFQAVDRIWVDEDKFEVFAELCLDTVEQRGHRLHPALFDAALHAMVAGTLIMSSDQPARTYVPARVDEFRFYRSHGSRLWAHGRGRRAGAADRLDCDITLVTDNGEIVAELIGVRAQALAEDNPRPRDDFALTYYEHEWRPSYAKRAGDVEGQWVVAGTGPSAAGLAREITVGGGGVLLVTPHERTWLEQITALIERDARCRGLIYLADRAPAGVPACQSVAAPLRLCQAISATARAVPLFLVTHGAQSVGAGDTTVDPFASAIWGFGRVVNSEHPELRCRLIDVDADADLTDAAIAEMLLAEITDDCLDEVALRANSRYVRRIERVDPRAAVYQATVGADSTPVRLDHQAASDGPGFTVAARRAPGPDEVEIEVAYVGLNFKDVLNANGLLPREALEGSYSQGTLGHECSGTIVRAGEAVKDLRVGDEVFAHSRDLFRSHVTLDALWVLQKPAALSLAQAASLLPVVTAYEALVRLAGAQRGDRVLVHSAAGGVGLSAVRLAASLGATVYATAGNAEKRQFLLQEGAAGVADSRSTDFADVIRRSTSGEGVDVVVNSLPGEMLRKSLSLLRPFGRFVELGKSDFAADHGLYAAPFRRALSFHAFDYDIMMAVHPEQVRACMKAVTRLYESGGVDPLPITEIPAADVGEAFRLMSRGEHIGKIVVRMAGETVSVPTSSMTEWPVRNDAAYVITGGLGGLGLTIAEWLADHGARHLVLVGRKGLATGHAEQVVAALIERGVEVRVRRADVANRGNVHGLFSDIRSDGPAIRGIIHAAADFDDGTIREITAPRLLAATKPKADGAWHLHEETRQDDLDFFVLFSSFAAQLGAFNSVAYATANEFVNGLARYRRALGLPAISIGWGMVEQVGVAVSGEGIVKSVLETNGHIGMSPGRFATEFGRLLHSRPVEITFAGINWSQWSRANPTLTHLPRFKAVVPTANPQADSEAAVPQRLRDASAEQRLAMLPKLIKPLLEKTTGLSSEQLDQQQSVDIDSLVAVELRVLMQNVLGISAPAVKMQRSLSVEMLTSLLAAELEKAPADPLTASDDISVHTFRSPDGLTVFGHLSLPSGPGPHPTVIVCTSDTGGALDEAGNYVRISEHAPLRDAGFAVFTVDQRGTPGHGGDFRAHMGMGDQDIDDILAAARYVRSLPQVDAARVSILGTSRGAYCALLAASRAPSLWERCVLIMGFYDPAFLTRPGPDGPSQVRTPIGIKDPGEIDAYFSDPRRRPLSSLGAVTAPMFLVHGDADDIVPLTATLDLERRAQNLGLSARSSVVPGLGHDNLHEDDAWMQLWPEIARFLGASPA